MDSAHPPKEDRMNKSRFKPNFFHPSNSLPSSENGTIGSSQPPHISNQKFRYLLKPDDLLRESGAKTQGQRLKMYGVKRFTKQEIRRQYPNSYVSQLLEEAEKKKTRGSYRNFLKSGVS